MRPDHRGTYFPGFFVGVFGAEKEVDASSVAHFLHQFLPPGTYGNEQSNIGLLVRFDTASGQDIGVDLVPKVLKTKAVGGHGISQSAWGRKEG